MMSGSVSTSGAYLMLQTSVSKIRSDLATTQAELSSGKPADYGLSLGAETNVLVGMQQQQSALQSISQTNGVATSRLDTTSTVLSSVLQSAQDFQQLAVQNSPPSVSMAVLQTQAKNALKALREALNTTVGGQSIFGGQNTDSTVMAQDPTVAGGAADTAFQSAFSTAFGMSSSSGSVNTLTGTQVSTFMSGGFQSLFNPAGWTSAYSAATDSPLTSRISLSRVDATSVSANNPAFAALAQAYSTIANMPLSQMNSDAVSAVLSSASATASKAIDGLTALQTSVGTMQANVTNATQAISVQVDAFTTGIEALDPIDPYATSTRVTELTTQLQTAYTLTSQLQHLSLAQYI